MPRELTNSRIATALQAARTGGRSCAFASHARNAAVASAKPVASEKISHAVRRVTLDKPVRCEWNAYHAHIRGGELLWEAHPAEWCDWKDEAQACRFTKASWH
jgi:hypothetical protein